MDDYIIDIPPRAYVLRKVLSLFAEFGEVANLRCSAIKSAIKSELLAMEESMGTCILSIVVVHKTKFLRVLGGEVPEGEEYEESMNKIRFKCKKIGRSS